MVALPHPRSPREPGERLRRRGGDYFHHRMGGADKNNDKNTDKNLGPSSEMSAPLFVFFVPGRPFGVAVLSYSLKSWISGRLRPKEGLSARLPLATSAPGGPPMCGLCSRDKAPP